MDYSKKNPSVTIPDEARELRNRALGTGGGSGSGGMDVKQVLSRGYARINRVCRNMPEQVARAAQGSAKAAIAFCKRQS